MTQSSDSAGVWTPSWLYRVAFLALYCLTSAGVFLVWFHFQQPTPRVANVADLAKGTAYRPYVGRRLLPDAARLLAAVVPQRFWTTLEERIDELSRRVPSLHAYLGARFPNREASDFPLLVSGYFLVWASVLGYLFACRALIESLYLAGPLTRDLVVVFLGWTLLGGITDSHYQLFPYDFPQAFVFTLALVGLVQRRWWLLPVFVLATYSKETTVLLLLGFALLRRDRSLGFWGELGTMTAAFVIVRLWIGRAYPPAENNPTFWYPWRNVLVLVEMLVLYSWYLWFIVMAVLRLVQLRDHYPWQLRRLLWFFGVVLPLAFFKGWFEELRQYTELMIVPGLILVQGLLHQVGLGHLLLARETVVPPLGSPEPRE